MHEEVAVKNSTMWQTLSDHHQEMKTKTIADLFAKDIQRLQQYNVHDVGLRLDFSKTHVTSKTIELLCGLIEERQVLQKRDALFRGDQVNQTEGRPALHIALRDPHWGQSDKAFHLLHEKIQTTLRQMETISDKIRRGEWRGYTGKKITDVVNIGIGGSDLGPRLFYDVVRQSRKKSPIQCHFISNWDPEESQQILADLHPETTIFVLASKSFTTGETLANAEWSKTWFLHQGEKATPSDWQHHVFAVTEKVEKAVALGIKPTQIFPIWEWVGGRFSLWSAVSFPVLIAEGKEPFEALLKGAYEMDQHFCKAPVERNLPILLALLGIWYHNFWNIASDAVVPYAFRLAQLPHYLQQLHMESLGKSVQMNGTPVECQTGPILWGGMGTNSQHSFHQWLMQGTQWALVDFVVPIYSPKKHPEHQALMANALAQSEVLAMGHATAEPYRTIRGNFPHTLILMDELSPRCLGALLALYEHKVFVQSAIWNINAFDQWGVERGKQMARALLQRDASAMQESSLAAQAWASWIV